MKAQLQRVLLRHHFLCFLGFRNRDDFDYAAPIDPDVAHPYEEKPGGPRCCFFCGGGRKHGIHQPPFVDYRVKEMERVRKTFED